MTKAEERLIEAVLARLAEWKEQYTAAQLRHQLRYPPAGKLAREMLKAALAVEKERG